MEKYNVYYLDVLIGVIEMSENYYNYKKCYDDSFDESKIFSFLRKDSNQLIPFFESRFKYLKMYNLNELKYVTDNYKIVKVI